MKEIKKVGEKKSIFEQLKDVLGRTPNRADRRKFISTRKMKSSNVGKGMPGAIKPLGFSRRKKGGRK